MKKINAEKNRDKISDSTKTSESTKANTQDSPKKKWSKSGDNWCTYILESLVCETTSYIGIATDVDRRLKEHNSKGKGHNENNRPGSWYTAF